MFDRAEWTEAAKRPRGETLTRAASSFAPRSKKLPASAVTGRVENKSAIGETGDEVGRSDDAPVWQFMLHIGFGRLSARRYECFRGGISPR